MSQAGTIITGSGPGGTVQTLTGNVGGPVPPTGFNINVVGTGDITVTGNPATSTLTISSSGAVADSFHTDSGTAVPLLGVLNISGGNNISTSGASNTVTVRVSGTTNHTVQLGNASGSLTSLTNGTTGQILTAVTGADPIWSTLATGVSSVTGTANQITAAPTTGNVVLSIPGVFIAPGSIAATTTVTGGTGVIATTGNLTASAGTLSVSSPVTVPNGGTGAITLTGVLTGNGASAITANAVTQHGILIGGASNAVSSLGVASNGQIPIGSAGADPVLATLTPGTGISITNGAGTITISSSGATTLTYTLVNTTPYVVLATDDYLGVDSSGGAIQINLPNAPATGRVFIIKDKTGSAVAHNITVTTVGGVVNIDGATTFVMNTNYESIQVIFNGASYEVF